jgi:hypothetical protein
VIDGLFDEIHALFLISRYLAVTSVCLIVCVTLFVVNTMYVCSWRCLEQMRCQSRKRTRYPQSDDDSLHDRPTHNSQFRWPALINPTTNNFMIILKVMHIPHKNHILYLRNAEFLCQTQPSYGNTHPFLTQAPIFSSRIALSSVICDVADKNAAARALPLLYPGDERFVLAPP